MPPVKDDNSGEIHPLKTWEELAQWSEPINHVDEIVNVKKLCTRASHHPPSYPKTLICHDMKGGYIEDRFYKGCGNKDAYRFYHWSGIDTFVYFSHALVTIPPPGWINAAHQHGVKVLGTLITEWVEGANVCQKILASEVSVETAVSQLVKIAKYHGFEGWLINIENEIDSEQIERLINFVQRLTSAMKEYCSKAVVIWYDSVTKEGKLDWQNELNDLNRPFFDACDGIFLNYTWTDDHLKRSREAAGEQCNQVYVGLDVFGRNFFGGGKFNTFKAMDVARSHNLSVAIFAQGWTHETQDNFVEAEKKLWNSLTPYLAHHGPQSLPFRTSFCQGFGEKSFFRGKLESHDPWHNLSKQQHQPLWSQEGEGTQLTLVTNDAFSGGGCLGLTTTCPATVRLFVCGIQWKVGLIVSLYYKWCGPVVPFSLIMHLGPTLGMKDAAGTKRILALKCEKYSGKCKDGDGDGDESEEVGAESSRISEEGDDLVDGAELVVDSTENDWTFKSFAVKEVKGNELKQIDVKLDGASSLLIGELNVVNLCIKGHV